MPKVTTNRFVQKAQEAGLLPDGKLTSVSIRFVFEGDSVIDWKIGTTRYTQQIDGAELMRALRGLITNIPPAITGLTIFADENEALKITVTYFGEME